MTYESIATLTIDDFHACITLYEISKKSMLQRRKTIRIELINFPTILELYIEAIRYL